MERGLLSDPKLSEFYDDLVWVYLYQDFTHSEADRAATRVAIRFGISSWPQHFLVNPYSLEELANTHRTLETFSKAVATAKESMSQEKVARPITTEELERLDVAASELEGSTDPLLALERLKNKDVVVRYRAIELLKEYNPGTLIENAAELLRTPHDQTRFEICKLLSGYDGEIPAEVRRALESLVASPVNSKNPNVLRINAVRTLGVHGDATSMAVIAPHANSRVYFNGLTGVAIAAVVKLARDDKGKSDAIGFLREGFPKPPTQTGNDKIDARALRSCTALAKKINDALNTLSERFVPFPEAYTEEARDLLVYAWRDSD